MRGLTTAAVLLFGFTVACLGNSQAACHPSNASSASPAPFPTPLPPEAVFHPTPTSPPDAVGTSQPFSLYTHCGINYADFDGKAFYADPYLWDGNGNPPSGWGNPEDNGTMTLKDQTTAEFMDSAGNCATFSTQPRAGIPTIPICS
jgi:hypothetical protein